MVWHTIQNVLSKGLRDIFKRGDDSLQATQSTQLQKLEQFEELLYASDLGPKISEDLLATLKKLPQPWEFQNLAHHFSKIVETSLQKVHDRSPTLAALYKPWSGLQVILLVGVNGVGKTTTAAKLAAYYQRTHKMSVMFAAADTFRAAAADQLAIWAQRLGIECIRQQSGADPAAVVFDAVLAAQARKIGLLIVDTGGRLHTKEVLMQMLNKINLTISKARGSGADQVFLVLDATVGHNGLLQAREFHRIAGLTGVIMTKLDGSAKGGILVQVSQDLGLPITFIGTGEKLENLEPFDLQNYAKRLFEI